MGREKMGGGRKSVGVKKGGRDGRKEGRGGSPGFSGEVEAEEEAGVRRWEEEKASRGLRPAAAIKERAE